MRSRWIEPPTHTLDTDTASKWQRSLYLSRYYHAKIRVCESIIVKVFDWFHSVATAMAYVRIAVGKSAVLRPKLAVWAFTVVIWFGWLGGQMHFHNPLTNFVLTLLFSI